MALDPWRGLSLKRLTKKDDIVIDDFVFRLHHQFNFFVVGLGVLFIFAENYLDGRAITCRNADEFATKFCWLHGSGHIGDDLRRELTESTGGPHKCTMNTPKGLQDPNASDERLTSYYIWLPFLLLISMGLSKIGRLVWKEFLEGGLLKDILLRRGKNEQLCPEKIAQVFKHTSKPALLKFMASYISCEVLNLIGVIVSMSIFNSVLHSQFWDYGTNFVNFISRAEDSELDNPMCQIFPTIVSCTLKTGGITGGSDKSNHICILSNNLFNMYYFLVLWFWWVVLISVSVVGLFYRLAGVFVPQMMVTGQQQLNMRSVTTIPQRFLLQFVRKNLDPDTFDQVCYELSGSIDRQNHNARNDEEHFPLQEVKQHKDA